MLDNFTILLLKGKELDVNRLIYICLAPWETATIKKDYNKVCDAYGCLGVLRLSLSKKSKGCKSIPLSSMIINIVF